MKGNDLLAVDIIDFRKAFNLVCPEILSRKLEACGISSNFFQWLNRYIYLSHHHQFIQPNGVKSPVCVRKPLTPLQNLL